MEIEGTEAGVSAVKLVDQIAPASGNIPAHLQECVEQLDQYFRGERNEFNLKLDLEGTVFQKDVWQQLLTIPYGKTVSYRDIALAMGKEKAVRAVGHANGQNKIWIIVPCHRVIGSNGKLTGYAGGLWRKEWLLRHEKALIAPPKALEQTSFAL